MKKGLAFIMGIFLMNILVTGVAFADKRTDTMTLLEKGKAYIEANGIENAQEAFSTAEFKNGDLYLFAYDYSGTCLAHAAVAKKVGKNFYKLKNAEGKYHIQTLIEIAKKGGDWYEYRWMHPKKKKMMEKDTYIMPIEGKDLFIGCGYWK